MKNVLITGITGTLGQAVSKKLLKDPEITIIGISRDEQKQRLIETHPRLTLFLCDVRDQRRVIEASRDIDTIFHFAALKCVDTLELNPEESIATNILGTENILGAQRFNKINRVVLSSTDKACKPINVYGACKMLSEKLVLRNPRNVVVRYGNVLASRGSVIPMFIKSIRETGIINITHESMTRFFLNIDSASDFIIDSAKSTGGLKIYPKMKAVRILDLAFVVGELLGNPKPIVRIMGMRPGEKIHEDLYHEFEKERSLASNNADQYNHDELLEILRPIVKNLTTPKQLTKKPKFIEITA